MICDVLAMGKQHLGPHVVGGYGIKIFLAGPFHYITRSPGCKFQFDMEMMDEEPLTGKCRVSLMGRHRAN